MNLILRLLQWVYCIYAFILFVTIMLVAFSFCYHRLIFWKDSRWECDLQNLYVLGRCLVPFDIYFCQAFFRNAARYIEAIHFCDQS